MLQLSVILRELVRKAQALLAELTMVPGDLGPLPRIAWDRIEDTHSNNKVRYSFTTDKQNEWLAAG